ncbi:MAG: hypothetical protein RM338_17640 [Nostoc sp. DedQUE12a]|nr:hypothetical protein [Nostoc sp. DedQUE12a]
MALSLDTIELSLDTMALSLDTMALSGFTTRKITAPKDFCCQRIDY